MQRRTIDLLVLSDIHLGYRGCRADALFAYLKTVEPARIVLNGDIIDIWQFSTRFWPESHLKVLRRLLKFAQRGVPIHYVIGNHDEALRKYAPFVLGQVELVDELVLELAGVRTWFIHGDRLDGLLATPRWLANLGCWAYDGISWVSCQVNPVRAWFGLQPVIPAAYFKSKLPSATRHIARFAELAARTAHTRGHGAVVCGHIHAAADTMFAFDGITVAYRNSGDWVESCTALEFTEGQWSVAAYADAVGEEALVETQAVA